MEDTITTSKSAIEVTAPPIVEAEESFFDKIVKWGKSKLDQPERDLNEIIKEHFSKMQAEAGLGEYTLLFLVDDKNSIGSSHADKIYSALSKEPVSEKIFLVINSPGGSIESAYLISKTCRRLCKGKFIVGVPRRAKSAATLIALGADEIHMGLMSELGPIDPQVSGVPALGLSNALR